jgi:hypothetical protein
VRREVARLVVQRASTGVEGVEGDVEKAVEDAIREGLEEMLGSRLAEAFYTTLNNFVKVLRGYPSLLAKPELVISFLRQNFKEASPKYEERIAELLRERLREMGIEDEEMRELGGRGDLLSLLRGLTILARQTTKEGGTTEEATTKRKTTKREK